eukprot:m.10187 g.10187  ORF g.10187 m.10187 type:complete len:215 (+) comp9608_c0_seq1:95-739(+)
MQAFATITKPPNFSTCSNMAYAKKVKIMSTNEHCECAQSPTMAEFVRSAYELNQRIKAKGSERCLRKSVLQRRLWRQLRQAFFDPRTSHLGLAESPALAIHERQSYPCQCTATVKGRMRSSSSSSQYKPLPTTASSTSEAVDVASIATSIQQYRATQPSSLADHRRTGATPADLDPPSHAVPTTPFVVRARQRRPCPVRSPDGVAMVIVATSDI